MFKLLKINYKQKKHVKNSKINILDKNCDFNKKIFKIIFLNLRNAKTYDKHFNDKMFFSLYITK